LGAINILLILSLIIIYPLIILPAVKRPALGLGILLFSLPIFNLASRLFINTTAPFPSLETIAVLLLGTIVLFSSFSHRQTNRPNLSLVISSLIFLVTALLSSLYAEDSSISLKILLTGVVAPLICIWIASIHVRTMEDSKPIIFGFICLLVESAIFTVLAYNRRLLMVPFNTDFIDWLYRESNAVNIFGSPSVTMAVIIPSLPLAAWYRIYGNWHNNLISILIILATLGIAILSLSRGAWLGTLFTILLSLPLFLKRSKVTIIVVLSILLIFFYVLGASDFINQAFDYRLYSDPNISSIDIRLANYTLSLQSATKHFFIGLGLGNYPMIYREFPLSPASFMDPLWFAHSLLLTLIPEIGLIGMLSFFSIFLVILRKSARFWMNKLNLENERWFIYAIAVGVISYLVIGSTSGSHLIALKTDYLTAPAMIVEFSFLGMVSGIISQPA
jgi:O-antigen ligase